MLLSTLTLVVVVAAFAAGWLRGYTKSLRCAWLEPAQHRSEAENRPIISPRRRYFTSIFAEFSFAATRYPAACQEIAFGCTNNRADNLEGRCLEGAPAHSRRCAWTLCPGQLRNVPCVHVWLRVLDEANSTGTVVELSSASNGEFNGPLVFTGKV